MVSLLSTVVYILMFEFFHLDLAHFGLGATVLMFYRIYKQEAVYLFGYLDLFTTRYTLQNILGWLACTLFYGYYFWRTNQLNDFEMWLAYPPIVIFTYFMSFQEGTKGEFRWRRSN